MLAQGWSSSSKKKKGEGLPMDDHSGQIFLTKKKIIIIHKLDLITIKYFCSLKDTAKRIFKKPQTWKKYLQIKYLITDFIPGYIKSSPNVLIRSQTNQ